MRRMSFMLTTQQMYARTKTVTRRMGWGFLKAGDIVLAVEKGMGLKRGEKSVAIYPIEIISVREEPLVVITQEEVIKEGFPDKTPEWFVKMFCESHKGCYPFSLINRIEFKELIK